MKRTILTCDRCAAECPTPPGPRPGGAWDPEALSITVYEHTLRGSTNMNLDLCPPCKDVVFDALKLQRILERARKAR